MSYCLINVKKTTEQVVDYSTACGLQQARPHPVDHPPRAPELGEEAAGMELTALIITNYRRQLKHFISRLFSRPGKLVHCSANKNQADALPPSKAKVTYTQDVL